MPEDSDGDGGLVATEGALELMEPQIPAPDPESVRQALVQVFGEAGSGSGKISLQLQSVLQETLASAGVGGGVAITRCPGGTSNIRNRLGQDMILLALDLKLLLLNPEDNLDGVVAWVVDAFNGKEGRTPPNGPVAFVQQSDDGDSYRVVAIVERRRTRTSAYIAGLFGVSPTDPKSVTALPMEAVHAELQAAGLFLPKRVVTDVLIALRSGKHLMLTGPPGTGKTSLALALGSAAWKSVLSGEPLLATATADWSSADTVGAYRLTRDGHLDFHPGQVLDAVVTDRWLVIDELNRADIDKAIGQLFTVLSGQAVVLPFELASDSRLAAELDPDGNLELGEGTPISIVPPGAPSPDRTVPIRISGEWRLVATMNDRDQDLLFSLSEALLRRFAVVEIPAPTVAEWLQILESTGGSGLDEWDAALTEGLQRLAAAGRALGAAVLIDCAKHLRAGLDLDPGISADPAVAFAAAWDIYIRPQLQLDAEVAAEIDPRSLGAWGADGTSSPPAPDLDEEDPAVAG